MIKKVTIDYLEPINYHHLSNICLISQALKYIIPFYFSELYIRIFIFTPQDMFIVEISMNNQFGKQWQEKLLKLYLHFFFLI